MLEFQPTSIKLTLVHTAYAQYLCILSPAQFKNLAMWFCFSAKRTNSISMQQGNFMNFKHSISPKTFHNANANKSRLLSRPQRQCTLCWNFCPQLGILIMQPAVVVVSLCRSDIFQLPAGVLGPRNCQLYFIAFLNFALTRPESSGLKYIYICQHDPPVLPMHSDVCLGFFAVPPK